MSLLEEFVFALSTMERQKLRPLQFRGAKRKIFLKILECREHSGIDPESIIRSYKLTKRRYYQLLSEMLEACYHDVAPARGIELLRYLGNKQLFRHLLREMHEEEKRLEAKQNKKFLEDYYFKILLHSGFFLIPLRLGGGFRAELVNYVSKYLQIKAPHSHDKLFQRVLAINLYIEQELIKQYDSQKMLELLLEFEAIYEELKPGNQVMAKFKTVYSLITYYARLRPEVKKLEKYVGEGKELMRQYPREFQAIHEHFELDCELELCRLKITDCDLPQYKNIFHSKQLWKSGFSLNYMNKFVPIILDAGDYTLAQTYIRKYFPSTIELVRNEVAIYYWSLLVLFHIYKEEYVQAKTYLEKAFSANRGSTRDVNFDMYLRRFEVFLSAMQEDPIVAEGTLTRAIRFASDHGFPKSAYLRTMEALIRNIDIDPAQAKEVRDRYLDIKQDSKYLYLFINRVYAKYFGRARTLSS